jgi:hypothetical protein
VLSVQRTFTVQRPSGEVFSYLSDFTRVRRTELDDELTRFEPTTRLVFTANIKTVTSTDETIE